MLQSLAWFSAVLPVAHSWAGQVSPSASSAQKVPRFSRLPETPTPSSEPCSPTHPQGALLTRPRRAGCSASCTRRVRPPASRLWGVRPVCRNVTPSWLGGRVPCVIVWLLIHLSYWTLSPLGEGALSSPEFFSYSVEAYEACKKRSLTSDIIAEQKKVQEADLVMFQFPLYWFSVPAILKGWMDRVLCQGFAFDLPGFYDDGLLKGKLAILSLTTGGTADMYGKTGASGDFRYFLWPLQHGTLHFCGFKVLAPHISFAPEFASEEERRGMVASWAQRLKTIWKEEPIPCWPPWYFGQ
ncbi:ribosyldihydronicotinamide dehydrogenase [quinone] isoform 1-T1 [Megaptera novaeangliae]